MQVLASHIAMPVVRVHSQISNLKVSYNTATPCGGLYPPAKTGFAWWRFVHNDAYSCLHQAIGFSVLIAVDTYFRIGEVTGRIKTQPVAGGGFRTRTQITVANR